MPSQFEMHPMPGGLAGSSPPDAEADGQKGKGKGKKGKGKGAGRGKGGKDGDASGGPPGEILPKVKTALQEAKQATCLAN